VAQTDLVITPVSGKADMKAFIDLPWRLYANDPCWVPPLKAEVRELLTPGKNPFFGHATAQYFLARRGGQAVGRWGRAPVISACSRRKTTSRQKR
jgi:hypothetical protein